MDKSERDQIAVNRALEKIVLNDEVYVFVKDIDLVYLYASDSFAHMTGIKSGKEIVGKTDYDLFSKELADKYTNDDRVMIRNKKDIEPMIETIPSADNEPHYSRTTKGIVYGVDGEIIGVYGLGRDVTEEISLKEEAREAKIYTNLVKALPGGIAILFESNGQIQIHYANSVYYEINHMDASIEDQRTTVYEADNAKVYQAFSEVKNGQKEVSEVDYRVIGDDGFLYWVKLRIKRAYRENGVQYYYGCYTDIDKQKKVEEELSYKSQALSNSVKAADIQYFTYYPQKKLVIIDELTKDLSHLEKRWENFPESFLAYTKVDDHDHEVYLKMLEKLQSGDESAECTVKFDFNGVYIWHKIHISAVRDDYGNFIKGLGYSVNVTKVIQAEDHLNNEKLRAKTNEIGIIDALTYNLKTESSSIFVGEGEKYLRINPSDEAKSIYHQYATKSDEGSSGVYHIMLAVLDEIPDYDDKVSLIKTMSIAGVKNAMNEGIYENEIIYRRMVNGLLKIVKTSYEVTNDPNTGDFLVFYISKDVSDEIIRKEINDKVIILNYTSVMYLDLQTNKFHVIKYQNDRIKHFEGMEYEKAIMEDSYNTLPLEERENFKKGLNLEFVKKDLLSKSSSSLTFSRDEIDINGEKQRHIYKNDVLYLDDKKDVLVYFLMDVTEALKKERENQDNLQKALKMAEMANKSKSEFLARISHDIRTPMNVINGMTEFAFKDIDNRDSLLHDLSDIKASNTFLLSLVNDILDLSKIENNSIELKPEPYSYTEYAQTVKNMFEPLCEKKGLKLNIISNGDRVRAVMIDKTHFNQITLNLLSNAVKYTIKGEVDFITESKMRSDGLVDLKVVVKDTGIGMSQDFQKIMFEPFTQEEKYPVLITSEKGTGLGLSIVKRLVALMNGTITCQSESGKGSEFTVNFIIPEAETTQKKIDEETTNFESLKGNAIVAEDHPLNAEIATRLLEEMGLHVTVCKNGKEAFDVFSASKEDEYQFIFMDIQMPEMNGYEASEAIRRLNRKDAVRIPIIAMSADAYNEDVNRALKSGMNAHVSKPISADSLRKAINKVKK